MQRVPVAALLLLALYIISTSAVATAAAALDDARCAFAAEYPRQYVAYKVARPLAIDGSLEDDAWRATSWTEDFQDIQGPKLPTPRFRTRAKMLWDDQVCVAGTASIGTSTFLCSCGRFPFPGTVRFSVPVCRRGASRAANLGNVDAARVRMRRSFFECNFLAIVACLFSLHFFSFELDSSVIYQDNDFEIFVDPAGTTHFYKEYEMNALNTTW